MSEVTVPGDKPVTPRPEGPGGSGPSHAELVRLHGPAVLAICLAHARRRHDAEDLMQETFVKAFAAAGTLREPDKLRPWLVQIARRVCIDHLRAKRPAAPLPEDVPARPETYDPRIDRLHAALGKLPEEYREPVSLYYLQGRDGAAVAHALGISPGAVRTRLLRARVMLYDLLKEDER